MEKLTAPRYCVKFYITGMPFPYTREFTHKRNALGFMASCATDKAIRDGYHSVELIDYKKWV